LVIFNLKFQFYAPASLLYNCSSIGGDDIGNTWQFILIFVIFRGNHAVRRRISPVQLLLLHTCAADLLFALVTLGTEILTLLSYPHFGGSDWLCKAMRYGQVLPLYASPFLLVAISADRYQMHWFSWEFPESVDIFQAICRPLANIRSSRFRRPNCFAAVAWILALLFSIPQLFIWRKKQNGECATFYGNKSHFLKNLYVIGFNTIAWLLPSIFAAFFYYCVCKAVWMSRSKAATLHQASIMEVKKRYVTIIEYKMAWRGVFISWEKKWWFSSSRGAISVMELAYLHWAM
ncbi:7 transmembrane receptor, partial [Cooperia oncophora]